MKKFLLLSILFAIATSCMAQSLMTTTNDTSRNATTQNQTIDFRGTLNNYDAITMQAVGTKVSGSPGGTVIIYGSIDGSNWKAIGADTMTITNTATQTHFWTFDKTRYGYYKAAVVTTGTEVTVWNVWVLGRKLPR